MLNSSSVCYADIHAAAERIRPLIHRTPVMPSETLSRLVGRPVVLKCENLQKTGSFKYRGATNAVQQLASEVAKQGVVTHSSGNHAQALAKAAAVRGIPAYVVMPRTAPDVKRQAVLGYGAEVILCEPTLAAREAMAAETVARTGGVLIPPFDHPHVIAGQGTMAIEFLQDVPDVETLIVPVGGGGMISGVALAAKAMKPTINILGAEPLGADDAARSFEAKQWQPQTNPNTIADGLLTSLGQLTWPIIRDLVTDIHTVTETEIVTAMRLVWERLKLIIEPSAAVGVAVALSAKFREQSASTAPLGIILCGGNVALDRLYW